MKANIARRTGLKLTDIAVAAGTCEGLGFVGERLGIAAYCTVVLLCLHIRLFFEIAMFSVRKILLSPRSSC